MQTSDKISFVALIFSIGSLIVAYAAYQNIEQENPQIHYSIFSYNRFGEERGFYMYRLDIFNSGRSPCFNAKLIADHRFYNFVVFPEFSQNIDNKNYSFEQTQLIEFTYGDDSSKKFYLIYYILPKEVKTVYFQIKPEDAKNDERLNIIFTCDNIESINISFPKKRLNGNFS